jgi:predicted alpha/beta-fold hydrolase
MNHKRLAILAFCIHCAFLFAEEDADNGILRPNRNDGEASVANQTDALAPIPPFYHPYKNGLYSTVVSMNLFYAPKIKEEEEIKLKPNGFERDLKVAAVLQETKAPLAVVVLGFDGRTDWPYARLLIYCLAKSGYHVLTFPSTYTISFINSSRHGVSGNVTAETDLLANLVAAFLENKKVVGRVERIGVVGISYGGIQALQLAVRANEGKLPFKLDGALALSPPVRLKSTAILLDNYYKDDRWKYTMVEMAKKFGNHEPVDADAKIPFADEEMRAAIGFVFRDELKRVVDRNDLLYKLRLLPAASSEYNREDIAMAWGFGKFIVDMAYPFWREKSNLKGEDDFWAPTELRNILPKLPNFAQAVVAADDPLNNPDDLAELPKSPAFILVPNGGHLGYLAASWTRARLVRLFEQFPDPRVLK